MISIEQKDNTVQITFSKKMIGSDTLERLLDRLRLEELKARNEMQESDAITIAQDIKAEYWKNNKNSFLNTDRKG